MLDLVWESTDTKQAAERLRKLLDIQDGTDPRIVLDMQVGRLTHEALAQLASKVNNLRNILRSP